jgi:hypothetical protein
MDTGHRADIDGLLDPVVRGPTGVDHLGKPQAFIKLENLRADLFATAAGNALLFHDDRDVFRQLLFLPQA